jgi:hypothetical protein
MLTGFYFCRCVSQFIKRIHKIRYFWNGCVENAVDLGVYEICPFSVKLLFLKKCVYVPTFTYLTGYHILCTFYLLHPVAVFMKSYGTCCESCNIFHQEFGQGCFGLFTHWNASSRSQWPRGLRRRSAAERLLGSWVRIPPGAWMFFCCECLLCQVEISALGWSLVQRSPTDCGVCLSVIKCK